MGTHADAIRLQLTRGPQTARQLTEKIGISQPSLSHVLGTMAADVVRIGAAKSIQYPLRDPRRRLPPSFRKTRPQPAPYPSAGATSCSPNTSPSKPCAKPASPPPPAASSTTRASAFSKSNASTASAPSAAAPSSPSPPSTPNSSAPAPATGQSSSNASPPTATSSPMPPRTPPACGPLAPSSATPTCTAAT